MAFKVHRALVSVSDKTGLVEFARGLAELGIELISTGGTADALRGAGVTVTNVAEITGCPEILGGRVKTLHPILFAGILAKRDDPEHMRTLTGMGIQTIDMVVCNLYPFEKVTAKSDCTHDEAIENIDVGGPSMIRAAAKNFRFVYTVTSPLDYKRVLCELNEAARLIDVAFSYDLMKSAFRLSAGYEQAISAYLEKFASD